MGFERSAEFEIGGRLVTAGKTEKCTAVVVAAGQGRRMGTKVQKQFLEIGGGKPVLYYSLACFQESFIIDDIILVTSLEGMEFCRKEIVEKYGLTKVRKIVPGGKERRDSVNEGLKHCSNTDYVFIHDGARPFVTEEILLRAMEAVRQYQACVVGVPAKDTVKLLDEDGFAAKTPDRKRTWLVQTPQCFSYPLICKAQEMAGNKKSEAFTDDAMVVEMSGLAKVKMVMGDYTNLKITTPEDLNMAEIILREKMKIMVDTDEQ